LPRPACSKCKSLDCSRVKRDGLMQTLVLPRFGYFPWKCTSCGNVFLIKERGKSKRHRSGEKPGDPDVVGAPGSGLPMKDDSR
jgi:hypothetical protein